jgi:ribosomal protein S27AE
MNEAPALVEPRCPKCGADTAFKWKDEQGFGNWDYAHIAAHLEAVCVRCGHHSWVRETWDGAE